MRRKLTWIAYVLLPVVVLGGMWVFKRDVRVRNREYPTQMMYSPAYKSQTENPVLPDGMTAQKPVAGTIPRGYKPFNYEANEADLERAGRELKNPFAANEYNLERGKYVYAKSCAVCHGASGGGDGPIIPKYPNPPAYSTAGSKALSDGEMFHIITLGRNNMPAHDEFVSADDRWKTILYIRQLQAVGDK